ncbi:hypothetical protein [Helicobacter japonicus]|uniref:hypothetical protein n=1 Tax=Helicobacter japonicus TaxID=425400 RepID=UPI0023EF9D12|nr:hypothetical protein [Helicobacter japonicus]
MQNYLILYNPYYENNVIGKHLEILKIYGQVAFGKVRDVYLANFTTPKYNNHTFTIYGNPYEYPLRIEPKKTRRLLYRF